VGVSNGDEEDFDFKERLEELNEELENLNNQARELEQQIADSLSKLVR
jgi:type I restriction enzyme M protein